MLSSCFTALAVNAYPLRSLTSFLPFFPMLLSFNCWWRGEEEEPDNCLRAVRVLRHHTQRNACACVSCVLRHHTQHLFISTQSPLQYTRVPLARYSPYHSNIEFYSSPPSVLSLSSLHFTHSSFMLFILSTHNTFKGSSDPATVSNGPNEQLVHLGITFLFFLLCE